jgi:hypothetical protein
LRLDFCVAFGYRGDLNHHHLVPRVHGGPDDEANLVTLCRECHGSLHGVEWSTGQAELIKAGLAAAKLRGIPGRKSWAEIKPALVREARRLRRRSPKGHQRSLRDVAAELAKLGFMNERGVTFSAASVQSMLA